MGLGLLSLGLRATERVLKVFGLRNVHKLSEVSGLQRLILNCNPCVSRVMGHACTTDAFKQCCNCDLAQVLIQGVRECEPQNIDASKPTSPTAFEPPHGVGFKVCDSGL